MQLVACKVFYLFSHQVNQNKKCFLWKQHTHMVQATNLFLGDVCMFFFLIYSCKHEQTHKQTCKHCTHPNPPNMFFFFTAIPAVEGANPGQLKSSILLTRRASKFGGKTHLLTRCFVLCQAPLSKVCVFFYPFIFVPFIFVPFEQGLAAPFWVSVFFPGHSYPLSKG